MADPHRPRQPDLERALSDLGEHLRYPPTPDVARRVRARLAAGPSRRRFRIDWPSLVPSWRRLAFAALALLLIAATILTVSSDVRTAVAKRFGVHGIEIVFVKETPTPVAPTATPVGPTPTSLASTPTPLAPTATPAATPIGLSLLLGEELTLDEARARVDYEVKLPSLPDLGAPDEVYLRTPPEGGMITLLYTARPGYPPAAETGVGILLMQFPGNVEDVFASKHIQEPGTTYEMARVNGKEGLWIGGTSHLFVYTDPTDEFLGSGRLAANVLLWEEDGVVYRLETSLSKADAIAIAESLEELSEIATPTP
jgi:hypothetical protein